jgi:two-component system, NarL family, nitrate/nitrite response regulator NarL
MKDLSRGPENLDRNPSRSGAGQSLRKYPLVVVDKSPLFRAGLTHILAESLFELTVSIPGIELLPEDAFADETTIALISLDDSIKGILAHVSSLIEDHKDLYVIMLSENLQVSEVFAALEAGASGYLLKNEITPDALLKSFEFVMLGGLAMPQQFVKLVRGSLNGNLAPLIRGSSNVPDQADVPVQRESIERFSIREQSVLKLLTRGASNKQIARELNIAEATVKVHVKNLLRKLGVDNRTKAAMWAAADVAAKAS